MIDTLYRKLISAIGYTRVSTCILGLLTIGSLKGQCVYTSCDTDNTFFGYDAGKYNNGSRNSYFGVGAGFFGGDRTSPTGSYNSFFGYTAGYRTSGSYNCFFGHEVGSENTTGSYNVFVGHAAGQSNTGGYYNSFIGFDAGHNNTTGSYNSLFGQSAGYYNSTGGYNAFFGVSAGTNNTIGGYNTFIGPFAGGALATGLNNICLGVNAGPTSLNSSVNNRLYIDVETKDDPLIYAEFDNDFVKINGTFEVRGGVSNPSSVLLKEKFQSVSAEDILEKVSELQIEKWSYIQEPEVRHIGPTAESFFNAFGLGADPQKINTIDADGVALIAIRALYDQITAIRKENIDLNKENEDLKLMMAKVVSVGLANESLVKVLEKRVIDLEEQPKNGLGEKQLKKSQRRKTYR